MKPIVALLLVFAVVPLGCCCWCYKPPAVSTATCPQDSVPVGTACVDEYEASVWIIPNVKANGALIKKVQQGEATCMDLTGAANCQGASGPAQPFKPAACQSNGQDCAGKIYAVSIEHVQPTSFISWFQAAEACANSNKRLPTNQEWQLAADGTPNGDSDDHLTTCNTNHAGAVPTGSRTGCKSARGAYDMVGNLYEWVADWTQQWVNNDTTNNCLSVTWDNALGSNSACTASGTPYSCCTGSGIGNCNFSNDFMCLVGHTMGPEPGALIRGGDYSDQAGSGAGGPLSISNRYRPFDNTRGEIGFRCAR